MGTRHLTVVVVGGEHKVAQYGQWDGYPDGAGTTILAALKRAHAEDFEDFREKVRSTRFISDEEVQRRWKEAGADGSGMVSMEVSDAMKSKYPQLQRDMGYAVVDHLIDSPPGLELTDSISFVADSLFCEYAYVVDLDTNTFEVYKGFNQTPLDVSDRFASYFSAEGQEHRNPDDLYYPVRLWQSFDLSNLPEEEDFLAALSDDEELEEEPTTMLKI